MIKVDNMKVENWNGYDIRFVEINGEWYSILKDICDALGLKTKHVAERLDPDMLERVRVNVSEAGSNDLTSRARKTQDMLAVNEIGIYEALFASRRLEARKFRRWSAGVMQKLRSYVGLQGYEALRLTEEEIQDQIDDILDCLFWDEEDNCLKVSVTVQGGDTDQIPFDEWIKR